jgi:hypothetical protein
MPMLVPTHAALKGRQGKRRLALQHLDSGAGLTWMTRLWLLAAFGSDLGWDLEVPPNIVVG